MPIIAVLGGAGIRRVQPTGPYCLLGYSFGGLVAHEVARQLQEEGEEIGTLIFLDTRAPGWALRRSNGRTFSYRPPGGRSSAGDRAFLES